MIIDKINLNYLRIFETVYRTKSMTVAADELFLTQSGVSQHIKALEEALDVKLFDRIKKQIIPTEKAKTLYALSFKVLQDIEDGLNEIQSKSSELSGTVKIGLPDEFGFNIVQPLLSVFGRKYPDVSFRLKLGLAPEMNEKLLAGELDFAFVDDFTLDKRITTEKIYDEKLFLCVSKDHLKKTGALNAKNTRKSFEMMDFISYEDNEAVLRGWFKHHYKSKVPKFRVKAAVVSPQLVAKFIMSDLGAGVIPDHLYEKMIEEKKELHLFGEKTKPLKNPIKIAYLKERTFSQESIMLRQWLSGEIKSLS